MAYTSYTYTLSGTSARQSHLKLGKYFTCHCERCLDPTELQTYFSSLICNKCNGGLISSTDSLGKIIKVVSIYLQKIKLTFGIDSTQESSADPI